MRSWRAAAFNASQNGASSEIDVRCPPMVNERLTGRLMLDAKVPRFGNRLPPASTKLSAYSIVALGAPLVAVGAVQPPRFQHAFAGTLSALAFGNAEAHAFLIGPPLALGLLLLLAVAVQVDDVAHHASGPIIFLGSTIRSNSSGDTCPPLTASSLRVVPFLWAVLAILAALS